MNPKYLGKVKLWFDLLRRGSDLAAVAAADLGGEWLCHSSCLRGPLPPLEWTKLVLRVSLSLENSSLDYFIIFLKNIIYLALLGLSCSTQDL